MELNRYYLVRKNNKVYCSKCGKPVLDDTYLFQRHQKDCVRKVNWVDEHGVEFEDFRNAYKEKDLHVFEMKVENELLMFNVYQLKMTLMPGWTDKYSGSTWELVFSSAFNHDSRIVEEHGQYNVDVWMKMMVDIKNMAYIGENPRTVIKNYFPSVNEIYNYGMFLDLYREKGYHYNDIEKSLIDEIELHYDGQRVYEHFIGDNVVLECYIHTKDFESTVFMSKDFIYFKGDVIDYKSLMRFYYPVKDEDIEMFCEIYPELMVKEYLKSGGRSIFSIIISSNYHKFVEMVGRAGMGLIADSYEQIKENINIHATNIQGMFGFNVKQCKKLNNNDGVDFLWDTDFVKAYQKAVKYQPGITSVEFNRNILRFIQDRFSDENNAFIEFNEKDVMNAVRYLQGMKESCLYSVYKDYINTCKLLGKYVCGKNPKELYEAHDKAVRQYELKADEIKTTAFVNAVSFDGYVRLASLYKKEEDDEIVESTQYEIILPQGPMDLQNESDHLGHCVKTYVDKVINGSTYILFLRELKNKNKPFATIEVLPDNTLIQLKAHSNHRAPASAQAYVKKWANFKGLKIRSYDFD